MKIIMKGRTPGQSSVLSWGMLGVGELIRARSMPPPLWAVALGLRPAWNPSNRPLPTSAWLDLRDELHTAHARKSQPMTPDDYQTMTTYYRVAYLNVREGSASEESWSVLAHGVNLCAILAENGIGMEWMPIIVEAKAALMRGKERGEKFGTWRLDGPGMNSVNDMLDVFESQLLVATRAEIVEGQEIIMQELMKYDAVKAEL